MRIRQTNTNFFRDEWVMSLTPDEKFFFTYFLLSPDMSTVGIANIPEKIIAIDTGYDIQVIKELKKRMEKSGKIIFQDNWVCLTNFAKHNPMTKSSKVAISGASQIESLPEKVFEKFNNKLKEMGAEMSLDDYLAIKRRNKAKKELRKRYPSLMGQQLEQKVDEVLGTADSGKMDWAELVADSKVVSDYPTPKSVKYEDFLEIGEKYKVRPYVLYWFYSKKISKLQASGRKKNNYKALLKELAPTCIGKELDFDTKIVAATLYAKDLKGVIVTRPQIESMIVSGEL